MSKSIKVTSTIFISFLLIGCAPKSGYISDDYIYNQKPIRTKAMHRATMKSYEVDGRRYYPTMVSLGQIQDGIASWYGEDFHGRQTSNGEYYNMYALTAAHKTLPMNTMVKVTNKINGKSVIVRINDRGPFVYGRVIDLSYNAAKKIGLVATGTAPVRLEIVGFDTKIITRRDRVKKDIEKNSVQLTNFAVQIGSFKNREGAKIYQQRYALVNNRYSAIIKNDFKGDSPLYRVWLKGFKSEQEARDFLQESNFKGSFIVKE